MPINSTSARDAALQRLRRTNRWLIAGSVLVTGVLTDVAANAFAGKTIKASSTPKRSGHSHGGSSSTTSTQPLRPPAQAPTTSTEAPPAQESQQAAPESSQQSAPSQESQSAPSQESAPAQEAAPSQEAQPSQETAPPAVSGGS